MPAVILDQEDRIIAALAGRPHANHWDQLTHEFSQLLQEVTTKIRPTHCERRGNFTALSVGVSYGGGQLVCIRSSLNYFVY